MDDLSRVRAVTRRIILGYSMGGYLAGYFALSRPKLIDELVTVGARIKAEYFKKNRYPNLNVLALHGKNDESVAADRQKQSCGQLQEMGANVSYRTIEAGHRLSDAYVIEVKKWVE
jgi:predicted esterase